MVTAPTLHVDSPPSGERVLREDVDAVQGQYCSARRWIWMQAKGLSRAYATMSVSVRLHVCRLSVTEVHWRIIANLGFKFRSKFIAHCGYGACGCEH